MHLLCSLPPTVATADALRVEKTNSSRWVHRNRCHRSWKRTGRSYCADSSGAIGFHNGYSFCLCYAAGFVSCGILVVMLMSFPWRHCIRHGAPPGCTWLDDTKLAVPPTRGLPRLAKSPKPVAGWRGQTKTPTPKAVATFIHRQQALVAGDQRPRGVFKLLRIHWGLLHFQSWISGRSSPCLSMKCLCSISLSSICCFK